MKALLRKILDSMPRASSGHVWMLWLMVVIIIITQWQHQHGMEKALMKINFLYTNSETTDKMQARDILWLSEKWGEQHKMLEAIKNRDAAADEMHVQITKRMGNLEGRMPTILQRVASLERRADTNERRHTEMDLMRLKGHGGDATKYLGHQNIPPDNKCMNCKPKGIK